MSAKPLSFCFILAVAVLWAGCTTPSSEPSTPSSTTASPASQTASPTANQPDTAANFPEMVQTIHQQVNSIRRSQGLEPLTLESTISAQARQHSETMAQTGNLSHDGFDQRFATLSQELSLTSAAENVGTNSGFENPAEEAVRGWQNSPGHRQNILGDFSKTGIGIVQTEQGQYYFTQIFGQL